MKVTRRTVSVNLCGKWVTLEEGTAGFKGKLLAVVWGANLRIFYREVNSQLFEKTWDYLKIVNFQTILWIKLQTSFKTFLWICSISRSNLQLLSVSLSFTRIKKPRHSRSTREFYRKLFCQTSQCKPRMMLQCFLWSVTIVISQLNALREIIFCYQHEMWTVADHNGLRHKIAVARMIHESTQLACLGCGINATRKRNLSFLKSWQIIELTSIVARCA